MKQLLTLLRVILCTVFAFVTVFTIGYFLSSHPAEWEQTGKVFSVIGAIAVTFFLLNVTEE